MSSLQKIYDFASLPERRLFERPVDCNDEKRRSDRKRTFDVTEFKRAAAASTGRHVNEVASLEKLAEGGYNRTFLVTMRDGFKLVGRIPYRTTEPKPLVLASEVATIDYLRAHDVPTPKIYDYSITPENPVGTEYLFMERMEGTSLADVWYKLSEEELITVVTRLVEIEARMFALRFPASGSLYYTKDLESGTETVEMPTSEHTLQGGFCIGPDCSIELWYGKRRLVQTFRGPYHDAIEALTAGANKEVAYLKMFGKPLYPYERMRREMYGFQKQLPSEHLDNLHKYLEVAPYLVPTGNNTLLRHNIRHPDLNPNNVFLSKDFTITGLIDWQHCVVLPLFLQSQVPKHFSNYGDKVSESLETPRIPEDFEDKSEGAQDWERDLLRKRQLHYFYFKETAKLNHAHYEALIADHSILRHALFNHASEPWEGDSLALKASLIDLCEAWPSFAHSSTTPGGQPIQPCPIQFNKDEVNECSRLKKLRQEADVTLQIARNYIGIQSEERVPWDEYQVAKDRAEKMKAQTLEDYDTELEIKQVLEHWPFGDFDEDEYIS